MWKYKGKVLKIAPEGAYGFTYKITDDMGCVYYGKKALVHTTKKTISKRARAASGTKKRVERGTKDSGWQNYWGSCKPLLEYIKEHGTTKFKREILAFYPDRQNLAYWEAELLIRERVLFREDCWNGNVLAKFFKGKIIE